MKNLFAIILGCLGGLFLSEFLRFDLSSGFEWKGFFINYISATLVIVTFIKQNLAVLLSGLAFLATAYQAYGLKIQNRQSVAPYLIFGYANEHENGFSVIVKNIGLGPAILEDYLIIHQDSHYRGTSIFDLLQDFFMGKSVKWKAFTMIKGYGIAVNEEVEILKLEDIPENELDNIVAWVHDSFGCVITCKSLYKECLVFKTNEYSWEDLRRLNNI